MVDDYNQQTCLRAPACLGAPLHKNTFFQFDDIPSVGSQGAKDHSLNPTEVVKPKEVIPLRL